MNCLPELVSMRIHFAQMSVKEISLVWSYYIVAPMQCFFFISIYQNIVSIKLYSGDYFIKLLNNTKLSNVTKNKYCILFMKDYLKNHGDCRCRNFAKYGFSRVERVKLYLVKHNSIFGTGYYNKKTFFLLFLISF